MKTQSGWDGLWYLHPADPLFRLAWFVYGCIEREHLLTCKAFAAHFALSTPDVSPRPDATARGRRAPSRD